LSEIRACAHDLPSHAAHVQPLVIATEDLHWADASTLELLQSLVEKRLSMVNLPRGDI
jgi:predicted ATPase